MDELKTIDNFNVFEKKLHAKTTSVAVAQVFEKEHKDVLKAIENLGFSDNDVFWQRNFAPSKYKDSRGKSQPMFEMTKDGFTFLAMGFTGKKATQFKIAYICQFNEMEKFIKVMLEARADCPDLTDAIMQAHEDPKPYHFSNELDMINSLVLGMNAKKFRELNGLEQGISIRPHMNLYQIQLIQRLQRIDVGLVLSVPDFQARKAMLQRQLMFILAKHSA